MVVTIRLFILFPKLGIPQEIVSVTRGKLIALWPGFVRDFGVSHVSPSPTVKMKVGSPPLKIYIRSLQTLIDNWNTVPFNRWHAINMHQPINPSTHQPINPVWFQALQGACPKFSMASKVPEYRIRSSWILKTQRAWRLRQSKASFESMGGWVKLGITLWYK